MLPCLLEATVKVPDSKDRPCFISLQSFAPQDNYFLLGGASNFTTNNMGLGDCHGNKYSLESQLNV